MTYILIVILILTSLLFLKHLFQLTRKHSSLPPGPFQWPVIGNLFLVTSGDPLDVFRVLREKYGNVFHLRVGDQRIVVLNGYDTIHKALVKQADDFSDREEEGILHSILQGRGESMYINQDPYHPTCP